MRRFISLLRGINVGGNTMIKMSQLKACFETLGFVNVATYINSGNIAFDAKDSTEGALVGRIEKAILEEFDKAISVMVREQLAVAGIIANNPFAGEFESHKEMHVLFLTEEMPAEKQAQLLDQQGVGESFAVRGREIYCHLKFGVAESLLGKRFIETKLKVHYTARNWRTVQKLAEL